MAVYVDNYYDTGVRYKGMRMCHMVADTTMELRKMVNIIGVNLKWMQHPNTPNEHFDICFSKRILAVKAGAIEIHFKEYAKFVEARCAAYGINWMRSSLDIVDYVSVFKRVKHPLNEEIPFISRL